MNEIDKICELLCEKLRLFLEFEECTAGMVSCNSEKLDAGLQKRNRLIFDINNIDRQIEIEADKSNRGDIIMRAVKMKDDQSEYPEDIRYIYNGAASVRSVMTRLADIEVQVGIRLRVEQKNILNQIRSANKGVSAQASKFISMTKNQIHMPTDRGKA